MKIGVISDIHANLPALEAVLDELDELDVDSIICVGDIVGVLGSPNEVVDIIRSRVDWAVYGNHDERVFPDTQFLPQNDVEVAEYEQVTESLSEENFEWLHSLSGMLTLDTGVVVAHSRPNSDAPSGFKQGDAGVHPRDYTGIANDIEFTVLLLGHTHTQHAVKRDKFDGLSGTVLNPGSVGHPYDHDTISGDEGFIHLGKASFAVVDNQSGEFELHSVEYDSTPVFNHLEESDLLSDVDDGYKPKGSMRRNTI